MRKLGNTTIEKVEPLPLVELADGQPAIGHRLVQHLRDPLTVGVRGPHGHGVRLLAHVQQPRTPSYRPAGDLPEGPLFGGRRGTGRRNRRSVHTQQRHGTATHPDSAMPHRPTCSFRDDKDIAASPVNAT